MDGPLNTRELAERVMCEKTLDASDTPLRNSVVYKVVQALRHAMRRGAVRMVEKRTVPAVIDGMGFGSSLACIQS